MKCPGGRFNPEASGQAHSCSEESVGGRREFGWESSLLEESEQSLRALYEVMQHVETGFGINSSYLLTARDIGGETGKDREQAGDTGFSQRSSLLLFRYATG